MMNETEVKLPRWLEARYDVLWASFSDSNFRLEDAAKSLREHKDAKEEVSVILSELKKAGWLSSEIDPTDGRKRIYQLKAKKDIFEAAFSLKGEEITRSDLESILKKAADLIRTRVDYKFILVLLFLKRFSDKWMLEYKKEYNAALSEGLSEEDAKAEAKNPAYHEIDFPEEFLWYNIRKDVGHLPENFSRALKELAGRNPDLRDVLDNTDFVQFTSNRENSEVLRQLVELFSERNLNHVSADVLGDAYEWILSYFAPQKAKEGEVYTPREVIRLLVEALDPRAGESVYDPASASNGMLIISFKHVEETAGRPEAEKLFLFGQEANHKTLALGRMNLFIHDIKNANLAFGDTLLYPKFKEGGSVKRFDVVIANPPWNQDGYEEEILKRGEFWRDRFSYGFPPGQSADWSWVQHMLASAKPDSGRVGVVIDNGCLFRGGKEGTIRSRVLEDDLVECVILLPEKLFYNTGASGAIMILRKNKPAERKNKVFFINASSEFGKHPEVRKLNYLGSENIQEIVSTYKDFSDAVGFSRAISLDEIRKNDYNLNVTLYVYPEEEHEQIDVNAEWQSLKEIEQQLTEVNNKIGGYLKEVG